MTDPVLRQPGPVPPSGRRSPSRIDAARRRAAVTRKALAWSAAAGFGALLVLVRVSHPAKGASAPALATPGPLLAQIDGSALGGGSIAPASAPPPVATSSS